MKDFSLVSSVSVLAIYSFPLWLTFVDPPARPSNTSTWSSTRVARLSEEMNSNTVTSTPWNRILLIAHHIPWEGVGSFEQLCWFGTDLFDRFQHLWIHRHCVKYGRHAVHADGLGDVGACDAHAPLLLGCLWRHHQKQLCSAPLRSQAFSRLALAVFLGLLIIYRMGSSPKPESVKFR